MHPLARSRGAGPAGVFLTVLALSGVGCAEQRRSASARSGATALDAPSPVGEPLGEVPVIEGPLEAPLLTGVVPAREPSAVRVSNDSSRLEVSFASRDGWELVRTDVAVALHPDALPRAPEGGADLAGFPPRAPHDPPTRETSARFVLDELAATARVDSLPPGTTVYVAARAEMRRLQLGGVERAVAWAGALPYPGDATARCLAYTLEVAPPEVMARVRADPTARPADSAPSPLVELPRGRTRRAPAEEPASLPAGQPASEEPVRPAPAPPEKPTPPDRPAPTPAEEPTPPDRPAPKPTPTPAPPPYLGKGSGSAGTAPVVTSLVVVNGITVGQFRTQTQGGWGTTAMGGNPGAYRDAHFAAAFPNGLVVGDAGGFRATFGSSAAIQPFLPAGGTPAPLARNHVDPNETEAGVLAGQVVALTLSLGFDAADPAFSASATPLAGLVVADPQSPFANQTVRQVLDAANAVLGGLPSLLTPAEVAGAVARINENFVDGSFLGPYLRAP